MAFPAARAPAHDLAKWAFFGLIGLCTVLVFFTDEQYWFHPADKFWLHIASYKGLLIVHALAGLTALLAGPLQFSDTIRRRWPRLHRRSGWTYVVAVAIAARLAGYIGTTYLPDIRLPTLVLVARDDILTPVSESEDLVAGIAGAELQILAYGAHAASVSDPEVFNDAVLTFLKKNVAQTEGSAVAGHG